MTDRNPAETDATDSTRTGVFVARSDAERDDALSVRHEVFVDEQGVDEELELDEHDDPDADTAHLVAYDEGGVVGAARVRAYDEETAKVERVAVAADRRGEGWGGRLMEAAEREARTRGFARVRLAAQTRVRSFYESLGYRAFGDEFEDAGIPHVSMRKPL